MGFGSYERNGQAQPDEPSSMRIRGAPHPESLHLLGLDAELLKKIDEVNGDLLNDLGDS